MNQKINCTVHLASSAQLDELCESEWKNNDGLQKTLPQRLCYVAEGEDGTLRAALVIREYPTVDIPGGKSWWIVLARVFDPANRRQGIGSALVAQILKDAQVQGVRYLSGMATKTSAMRFWQKQGFSLIPFGHPKECPGCPDIDGNIQHILLRRSDEESFPHFSFAAKNCVNYNRQEESIRRIEPEERDQIISKSLLETNPTFWKEKGTSCFGFLAERQGKTVGWVLTSEREIGAPLQGVEWNIPAYALFAEEESVARLLLERLEEEAREKDVTQFLAIVHPRESATVWENRGFALFDCKCLSEKNEFMYALRKIEDGYRFACPR